MVSTLRRWLISGLLVSLPLVVTVWVLDLIVTFLDRSLKLLPKEWQPDVLLGFTIPGLGVVLTVCFVLLIGAFASNYLGARLFKWWDELLGRIPIVRSIYSAVKQISDTLFSSKGNSFREAVLVEYPRRGLWTVAFVTGKPTGELADHMNPAEFISIYVPTTPNPTSGFYIMLPIADVIPLSISVEEALKVIVSMGVIAAPEVGAKKIAKSSGKRRRVKNVKGEELGVAPAEEVRNMNEAKDEPIKGTLDDVDLKEDEK